MSSLLELANLEVHYGGIHALRGIDLKVEAGQIVALIGANGAGKSTTLRAISGLVKPSRGSIKLEGRELVGVPAHQIVAAGVSQAPEGRGIFANLTVDENLEVGSFLRTDRDGIARDREQVLTLFPRLRERLAQEAGTLSGGEQQMLAIGRAMLARPKLLLLDEPSLGLAPQIVKVIFQIIETIAKSGTTILLVEQNAHLALRVSHHAYVLEVGKIAVSGPSKQLASDDAIRRAYLGVH